MAFLHVWFVLSVTTEKHIPDQGPFLGKPVLSPFFLCLLEHKMIPTVGMRDVEQLNIRMTRQGSLI